MSLRDHICRAWRARTALHADDRLDAYRLFHGWGESCAGLEIDRYGEAAFVRYRSHLASKLDEIAAAVGDCHRFPLVIAKARGREPVAMRGKIPGEPFAVNERGLRFWVEAHQPGNPGLFLDSRPARAWLLENSRDRRVLNLFSFTGSLGVAAAVGGAKTVVHIDSQRGALRRCRANHELNRVPIDERDLMNVNLYQHLRKAAAGRRRFDGVIVDPPPLEPRDRTPGPKGLAGLAPLVARMLDPGGWMLCLIHGDERPYDQREREVIDSAGVPMDVMWRGASGDDFPDGDPKWKLRITAFRRLG